LTVSSAAEVLLGELRTKVDGQIATLESARTRAAVALSASGVVAGLFAQHLTRPVGNWGLAALAAFVAGGLPAIWILGPHKMTVSPKGDEWITFATGNDAWVRGQVQEDKPHPEATGELGASELAVQMVSSLNGWYETNQSMLKWINRCIAAAFLALIVQLICWVAASIG
jgi:hypothetical protein